MNDRKRPRRSFDDHVIAAYGKRLLDEPTQVDGVVMTRRAAVGLALLRRCLAGHEDARLMLAQRARGRMMQATRAVLELELLRFADERAELDRVLAVL